MKPNVREVFQAANQGPAAFRQWLAANPEKVTNSLAREIRAVFKEALAARDGNLAELAAMLASTVYLHLGKRYDALYNLLDYYQLGFMRAEQPAAYKQIHTQARDFVQKAVEIKALDLAFQGHILAADCTFFAAEASEGNPKEQEALLLATLEDLAGAALMREGCTSEVWLERFVSLLSAASQAAASFVWLGKQETRKTLLLKQITAQIEPWIPLDFHYAGNDEKTEQTARNLANLSYEYGSADLGNRRLDIAINRMEGN